MSLFIRLTLTAAAVFLLASCGGGSAESPPLPSSGRVVEGYLNGATVVCDSNGNGVADAGEPTATTDAGGNFTFAAPGCASGMLALGGTDVDTGLKFRGVLKAPAGATVVTPLTTLLVGGMSQARVIAALGLPANTDIPNANPAFDPVLMRKSLAIEQLLIKTTEMFAGLGGVDSDAALQAIYGEVAASYAVLLQGGGTLITGNEMDSILVAQLVKAATQRVASSSAVDSKVKAALSAVNAESLGIVSSGGLTEQAENILKAADADITAKAKASQSDTTITEFVVANAATLADAPTSATYALGAILTEQVADGLGTVPEVPAVAATFPITFDGATSVSFVGFNGAEGSTIEAGPDGGSGKSLRILRSGGEPYAGAFVTTEPIAFAADKKTFTARVYSPKAGIRMVLKLEGAGEAEPPEYDATTAVVEGWQTLSWVAARADLSKRYTQITLLPNLGTVDAAPGQSYYFDDITLVQDSGTPPATGTPLPIDFDDALPTTMGQFGAGAAIAVAAGPTGGSGNAAKFTKSAGDTWAGFYFPTATIAFTSTSQTITAKVYSPKAGAVMVMKAENGVPSAGISSGEVAATSVTVVGWQTMTWAFTGKVDLSKTYNSIAIIPDSAVVGAGQAYFFDDITLVADSGTPPPPPAITFDETTPPVLGQFGAGAAVTIAAGPTGGSGNAAKFTKSAGDTWAGFFFPTSTIPISTTSKTITARVHSSKAGAPMGMKIEGPGGVASAEVTATPTTVLGWHTLTWVFTGLDASKTYNSIAIIPDTGTSGSGQIYYFDDITFVADAVIPPPATGLPLPITFDEAVPPTLGQFGDGAAVAVAAGPTGGSGNAAKFTKSAGNTWAGFYFPTATIAFTTTSKTIRARVHSSKAGAPMFMKVEGPGGAASAEIAATPVTVVGWQTLTWVFNGLDLSKTYNSIAILPDSGTSGSGQVYYFDDVTLVADGSVVPGPTDYLALVDDSISLVNGTTKKYTMAEFESDAGISVGWPMSSTMKMKFALKEVGNALTADLKVTAAVEITETVPTSATSGNGAIRAYIANVDLKKTAAGIEITVPPTSPDSLAYTVSKDAKKTMVIDFAGGVKVVDATLTTAANMTNSLIFGEVVQYAINSISGQGFTGIYQLRGKYRVKVVLVNVPLRKADGSTLPTKMVVVPTLLGAGGVVLTSKTVEGPGLEGYVTLTD